MTVVVALASACGGATEGTATGGVTEGASESSGNNSFPTTGDTTQIGVSDSDGTTAPTSGESNSNSNSNSNTDPTTTGGPTDPVTTTTSEPGTDTSRTSDTETGPGTDTSTGDTTMGVVDTGDTDTSTTGPGETTDGSSETTGPPVEECGTKLQVLIRDFKLEHPDFEDYAGNAAYKGIVQATLGADQKPVYAHPGPTQQTSGPDAYKQWYNDTPGVNQAIPIELDLTEVMPGLFQFNSNAFFPVDNQGFGNQGQEHNFAFTSELHTQFLYSGGETFTFTGDDDLWMFINGKLAIDLGGLHPPVTDTIFLDAQAANLGIEPGGIYNMDIFHAERHSTGSNFRIDTTIGCFVPQ